MKVLASIILHCLSLLAPVFLGAVLSFPSTLIATFSPCYHSPVPALLNLIYPGIPHPCAFLWSHTDKIHRQMLLFRPALSNPMGRHALGWHAPKAPPHQSRRVDMPRASIPPCPYPSWLICTVHIRTFPWKKKWLWWQGGLVFLGLVWLKQSKRQFLTGYQMQGTVLTTEWNKFKSFSEKKPYYLSILELQPKEWASGWQHNYTKIHHNWNFRS